MKKISFTGTDYLFARPSFIEGIARNIDMFGTLNCYNYPINDEDADYRAMKADRAALRADFAVAFQKLKNAYPR
jgi:hypothetical protein